MRSSRHSRKVDLRLRAQKAAIGHESARAALQPDAPGGLTRLALAAARGQVVNRSHQESVQDQLADKHHQADRKRRQAPDGEHCDGRSRRIRENRGQHQRRWPPGLHQGKSATPLVPQELHAQPLRRFFHHPQNRRQQPCADTSRQCEQKSDRYLAHRLQHGQNKRQHLRRQHSEKLSATARVARTKTVRG